MTKTNLRRLKRLPNVPERSVLLAAALFASLTPHAYG